MHDFEVINNLDAQDEFFEKNLEFRIYYLKKNFFNLNIKIKKMNYFFEF